MPSIQRPRGPLTSPTTHTSATPVVPTTSSSTMAATSTAQAPLPSSGGAIDPAKPGAGPSSMVGLRAGVQPVPFRHRPQRSAGFVVTDTRGLAAPTPTRAHGVSPSLTIAPGTTVTATIKGVVVSGTLAGFDHQGRPVITDGQGARRVAADHAGLTVVGSAAAMPSVLASLPLGAVVTPPVRLQQALDAALDLQVVGTHTAREYTDAFTARGFEVFVVGGGVRDAIAALTANPNATDHELLALLNDVDIVTTAPPPVARALCEEVAPELAGGGVWSPKFVEQFGVVLAGGKKAGLPQSDGLDVASMKVAGMHGDMQHNADTGERGFQTTFGFDIAADARARDFCCNALYYDPRTKLVVDPTLQGVADAEQKLLHPVRDPIGADESTASPRFWKFRLRGFQSDGEARRAIRQHAQAVFSSNSGKERWRLQNALGRSAPKDATTPAAVETWLKELRAAMHQDHCADLFDRAIRGGVRQGVINEVLKRTQKGAAAPPPTGAAVNLAGQGGGAS